MGYTDQYRAMARYNTWMNRKLYGLAAELSPEERNRDLGAFFHSLHGTLAHVLLADRVWMARFTGDRERFTSRDATGAAIPIRSLDQVLYSELSDLDRERRATDEMIEAWTAGLTEEALAAPLAYRNSSGQAFEHPLWWAVSHFFNHQTHHRGQATTLFKQLGRDPGVTDLAAMLRSE
jgi:uncharacterized damage-inducible protein DinB